MWGISRTAGIGGLRFNWEEDTGWSYARFGVGPSIATPTQPLDALHRVFAAPDDIAEVAEHLVRTGRMPTGEFGAEGAGSTRAGHDRQIPCHRERAGRPLDGRRVIGSLQLPLLVALGSGCRGIRLIPGRWRRTCGRQRPVMKMGLPTRWPISDP